MKTLRSTLILLAAVPSLSGCVGYNSALFMTKSNVGVDFDTKPPTAEISIARREGVLAPTFEGGQTPPVMASFKTDESGISAFMFGISQTFSGGDASLAMAKLYDKDTPTGNGLLLNNYDSALNLTAEPEFKVLGFTKKLPASNRVRPFLFGTDTSFGLKVAWSGISAQVPDTIRLGFSRKEFAFAPVTQTQAGGKYVVKMPSFLATIDNDVKVGGFTNTNVRQIQYFATGETATELALQEEVRRAMYYRADPAAPAKAAALQMARLDSQLFVDQQKELDAALAKPLAHSITVGGKNFQTTETRAYADYLARTKAKTNLKQLRRQGGADLDKLIQDLKANQ